LQTKELDFKNIKADEAVKLLASDLVLVEKAGARW
jgi:hypothetical protein